MVNSPYMSWQTVINNMVLKSNVHNYLKDAYIPNGDKHPPSRTLYLKYYLLLKIYNFIEIFNEKKIKIKNTLLRFFFNI
jgi:hypothetical protein